MSSLESFAPPFCRSGVELCASAIKTSIRSSSCCNELYDGGGVRFFIGFVFIIGNAIWPVSSEIKETQKLNRMSLSLAFVKTSVNLCYVLSLLAFLSSLNYFRPLRAVTFSQKGHFQRKYEALGILATCC